MATLITASRRLASGRVWTIVTIVFVAFALLFFASGASFAIPTVETACGQQPLDVRFTSTATEVHDFLTDCGADGRDAYRSMQIADLFYPAAFGLFMATSLALSIGKLFPRRPRFLPVAMLPLLGAAFDYVENVFAWSALSAFPEPAATDSLLGVASAAKTTTFWIAGALLLLTLVALTVRPGLRQLSRTGTASDRQLVPPATLTTEKVTS